MFFGVALFIIVCTPYAFKLVCMLVGCQKIITYMRHWLNNRKILLSYFSYMAWFRLNLMLGIILMPCIPYEI